MYSFVKFFQLRNECFSPAFHRKNDPSNLHTSLLTEHWYRMGTLHRPITKVRYVSGLKESYDAILLLIQTFKELETEFILAFFI